MFPSDGTRVAVFWNTRPLRHTAFLHLRVAIGMTILVYLAKSGQINFSSLTSFSAFWNIPLGLFGRFAYLFGIRRIVYSCEEGESLEADSGYIRAGSN